MNRFKDLRKSARLTQQAVADMLSVRQNTYSNWERGAIIPSVDIVEALASFYGVSTDYLLGLTDDSDQQKKPTEVVTLDEPFTDPVKKEALSVFSSLSPEDQQFFLDMMRHRANQ